jgi:hypothetical protein
MRIETSILAWIATRLRSIFIEIVCGRRNSELSATEQIDPNQTASQSSTPRGHRVGVTRADMANNEAMAIGEHLLDKDTSCWAYVYIQKQPQPRRR